MVFFTGVRFHGVCQAYRLRRSCYQGLDHKSASSLTNPRGAELSKCEFSSVQAAKIL